MIYNAAPKKCFNTFVILSSQNNFSLFFSYQPIESNVCIDRIDHLKLFNFKV